MMIFMKVLEIHVLRVKVASVLVMVEDGSFKKLCAALGVRSTVFLLVIRILRSCRVETISA